MSPRHDPLFRRIDEFAIDDGTPALTFADRLARENGWRRVDAGRYWLVPKLRLRLARTATVMGVFPLGAAVTPDVFPFTLRGAEFLAFYVPAYTVAFLVALLLRWILSRPGPDPDGPVPRL